MIFISAGHHKARKGARFKDIFNEFDEAIKWQKSLLALLGNKGIAVPSGRLPSKVEFINNSIKQLGIGKHIALEIHFNSAKNSYGNHVGRGSETLYCPDEYTKSTKGKELAEIVQDKLGIVFGPTRGIKEGYYQMNPDKGPDYFLAKTNCPAIIIEPGFVQNYEKIAEGRDAGCAVIAGALLDYLGE